MNKRILYLVWVMALVCTQAYAQTRKITGTVKDAGDGSALPGVSVSIKGTSIGTQTDGNGNFSINVPAGKQILTLNSIGYTSQTVAITSNKLNVALVATASQLSEVVISGYSKISKKDYTGSAVKVTAAQIADKPVQSFDQALAGQAAGVNIIQPNGVLNNPPVFRIRGFNSISLSSYPLIIIDNVPVFTSTNTVANSASSNPLGDINPNDIESVFVLKDASATAIYGSRAANGVVVITTKKGKLGKTQVNYDGWVGINKAFNLPKLLNADQYVELKNEARANAGLAPGFAIQKDADGNEINTDWYKVVYQTGLSHNHNLNFSGATEKTSYFVSTGYSNQESFIKTNSFERKIFRGNLDHHLSKSITIGTNFSYSNSLGKGPNSGSLPGQAYNTGGLARLPLVLNPNVAPRNPDGSYNITSTGTLGLGANTIANNYPNALVLLDLDKYTSGNTNVIGDLYGEWELVKGLKFRTQYSINKLNIANTTFQNPIAGDGQSSNGLALNTFQEYNRRDLTNKLEYIVDLGKNNIDTYIGYEEYHTTNVGTGTQRTNLADSYFNNFQGNFLNVLSDATTGNFQSENGFRSYFANLNYSYDKKYLLSGSFRRDGFSGLSANNKYGNFGGGSVGWNIAEEDFFKQSRLGSIFEDLKLKGSYGVVGNVGVGDFASLSLYNSGLYGSAGTVYFNQAGNSNLKWETSKKTDIGISFGLFKGRIQAELDYYNNSINNLILNAPQSPSRGIPGNTIAANVGSMYNRGFELNFTSRNIVKNNFSWTTNFNISTLSNKVTALAQGNSDIYGVTSGLETASVTRVGYTLGSIFVVPVDGVNPANGQRIFINRFGQKVQYNQVGTPSKWTYLDGTVAPAIDGTLDGRIAGRAIPTYYGGLNNTFTYKSFDLNIGITFSGGNKIYNGTQATLRDQRFWNNETGILRRWTTPGQVTDIPKVVYGDNYSNGSAIPNSSNVQNGSYAKLKNVALGYKLPTRLVNRAGISSLRVYVQATNLAVVTGYKGSDPEVSSNGNSNLAPGIDRNTVPSSRIFTFGLNVGF
ncbi:SusC/RagA family TonB-linked outer membrane protein [Mucilaginibacter sp. 22184]|uniref:SusC/RagA family TonB-linked outer membrane protein n=1 Tax=Mucilaginibacter sp. 22184 TaxID=3453887 RepID=UPI003F8636BD